MSVTLYITTAVAIPLVISLIIAIALHRGRQSLRVFVIGGRDISRRHYVATLTASNAALANILFLYVYWGYVYGIWAWLWGSLFWAAGFMLFSRIAKAPKFAELTKADRPEFGFNELMGTEYSSKLVTVVCGLASGLAFLLLLTLELNVGAKIFSGLTPTPNSATPYVLALVLGSVLAAYAAYGGMKAVFHTDVLQLLFIIAAAIALLLLVDRLSVTAPLTELMVSSAKSTPVFALSWSYIPFIFGSLFSWGFWFICTMDMWQRTIATKVERPALGIKAIFPSFLMLSGVTFSGVMVGVFVKHTTGAPFPPKYPLVDFLHLAFSTVSEDPTALVLLCVVVSGLTAAMLSTVDTYLIIISQSFMADAASLQKGHPHERVGDDEYLDSRLRRRVQVFTAVIPFMAVAIFYLLNEVSTQDTFTLYMIAGSIPFATLPFVLGALWISDSEIRSSLARPAAVSASIAICVSIVGNLVLAQYALASFSPVAFGLLYFMPLLTAAVAALPFVRLLRR